MHSDSTLPRSPRRANLQPALYFAHAVQGLQTGLNNSKVLYTPGYPSKRSNRSSQSSATPRTRNVHVCFQPTTSTPEIALRVFRGAYAILIPVQLSRPLPDQFYDGDSEDECAIFDSAFHLRPSVPERNLLISPLGSSHVGWEQTHGEPPNEVPPSLKTSSALSNSCASSGNRRTGNGKAWEAGLAICARMKMESC